MDGPNAALQLRGNISEKLNCGEQQRRTTGSSTRLVPGLLPYLPDQPRPAPESYAASKTLWISHTSNDGSLICTLKSSGKPHAGWCDERDRPLRVSKVLGEGSRRY